MGPLVIAVAAASRSGQHRRWEKWLDPCPNKQLSFKTAAMVVLGVIGIVLEMEALHDYVFDPWPTGPKPPPALIHCHSHSAQLSTFDAVARRAPPVVYPTPPYRTWFEEAGARHAKPPYDFVVVTLIRDNRNLIAEFIARNYLAGAQHFYFFDNSHSPLCDHDEDIWPSLQPFVAAGLATVLPIQHDEGDYGIVAKLIRMSLDTTRGHARWVMFIDLDEFIALENANETMLDVFDEIPDKPGLCLLTRHMLAEEFPMINSWDPMDSLTGTFDRVCSNFTKPESFSKTAFQPYLTPGDLNFNPHVVRYLDEQTRCVLTDGQKFDKGDYFEKFSYGRAWIQHYYSRSMEDLVVKRARGINPNGKKRTYLANEIIESTAVCPDSRVVVPRSHELQPLVQAMLMQVPEEVRYPHVSPALGPWPYDDKVQDLRFFHYVSDLVRKRKRFDSEAYTARCAREGRTMRYGTQNALFDCLWMEYLRAGEVDNDEDDSNGGGSGKKKIVVDDNAIHQVDFFKDYDHFCVEFV